MNWLTRSPEKDLVVKKKATGSFGGGIEIVHRQWTDSKNRYMQDLFVNPDQASPVAAVLVGRSEEHGALVIELIARKEAWSRINQATTEAKLSFGGMAMGLRPDTNAVCDELGLSIENKLSLALLLHSGSVADDERKQVISERAQKVIKGLHETTLLSSDENIRSAFVKKMSEELQTVRALGDQSQ